ncbi:MAG TPA: signal recognition particle protein [Thermoanaerobaculaceae bacterium]|nr:signal recognition particle protein [Thermoanaerobaculaceae bacterium]HPS78611.1 signal recognition particle protein [Thermoanaerobaculaceae bacterium]
MLEAISERLQKVFRTLRGEGHLTEKHMDEALAEIRRALLSADVALAVVKDFVERVRERSLGKEVLSSLSPAQQVVKIVHEELTRLLGGEQKPLRFKGFPAPIMLVGLQGTGKTTTAAKLGLFIKSKLGKHVLLAPADTQRPAAREQLEQLGRQAGLPVLDTHAYAKPTDIARAALIEARRKGYEVVLLDTAGRLHIDDALMTEISELQEILKPSEVLLVADAMTGQDAVRQAEAFSARLPLTGVILTKLDGDARGGAALSVVSVTGKAVRMAGIGEQLEDLEPFHPDRMASRILGMGDMLTFIEKAQAAVDEKTAAALEKKLKKEGFDLEDLRDQLKQMRGGGLLGQLVDLLPGARSLKNVNVDDRKLGRFEAIIASMTTQERRRPDVINGSRRKRIARGAGTTVEEVNRLLRQYAEMKKMLRRFGSADPKRVLKGMGL